MLCSDAAIIKGLSVNKAHDIEPFRLEPYSVGNRPGLQVIADMSPDPCRL